VKLRERVRYQNHADRFGCVTYAETTCLCTGSIDSRELFWKKLL